MAEGPAVDVELRDASELLEPMGIFEVLKTVRARLEPSHSSTCMSVYRQWVREVMQLKENGMLKEFIEIGYNDLRVMNQLKLFIRHFRNMYDLSQLPCRDIRVSTDVIKKATRNEDSVVFLDFFKTISPFVSHLTIRCSLKSGIISTQIEEKHDYHCLESLTVLITGERGLDNKRQGVAMMYRPLFQLFGAIMEKAPLLQKLYFDADSNCTEKVVPWFLQAMTEGRYRHLSQMEIKAPYTYEDWCILCSIALELETLKINFTDDWKNATGLYQFLAAQYHTLKSLTITSDSPIQLEIPQLSQLESYTFEGIEKSDVTFHQYWFPHTPLKQIFPALKSLSLQTRVVFHPSLWRIFLDMRLEPMETVQHLALPNAVTDPGLIVHSATLFPNVKDLGIPAYEIVYNAAVEVFPGLEKLSLDTGFTQCIDHLLIGVCPSACINKNCNRFDYLRGVMDIVYIPGSAPQALSRLNSLKALTIHRLFDEGEFEITEVSVSLSLLAMDSLESVDFGERLEERTPDKMILEPVWTQLKEKCFVTWEIQP